MGFFHNATVLSSSEVVYIAVPRQTSQVGVAALPPPPHSLSPRGGGGAHLLVREDAELRLRRRHDADLRDAPWRMRSADRRNVSELFWLPRSAFAATRSLDSSADRCQMRLNPHSPKQTHTAGGRMQPARCTSRSLDLRSICRTSCRHMMACCTVSFSVRSSSFLLAGARTWSGGSPPESPSQTANGPSGVS